MSKTAELFGAIDDDDTYLTFAEVAAKRSSRADLHAFLLLDELVPSTKNIVACAEHDVFYLSTDIHALDQVITSAIVQELRRCGVMYDQDAESLSMFV